MKIGILTFHYAYNYGALFQAVSLFDYLRSLGHDVYMIDYHNSHISESYSIYPSMESKKNYKFYLTLCFRMIMRIKRFNNFKKYINDNLSLISPQNISQLDSIVIGSDQVWNTKLTNGYDPYYWGNIPFKGKIISYAASMNAVKLSDVDKERIAQELKNFSSISVRENSLVKMLKPLTKKKISWVLDPTMLNDYRYWNSQCSNSRNKEKYVLAYPLRDGNTVMSIAETIAKQKTCKLKVIKGCAGWNPFTNVCNTAGPKEVLSLIKNAEFVVTSSFHGTALSILLNKQFYTIKCKDGNNVRTESMLNLLNLTSRLISNKSEIHSENIDYSVVESILKYEREKSRSFLNESLHE